MMIINDKDRDGVFGEDDEHCTINGERDDVNQEALCSGGFNVKGERERDMTRMAPPPSQGCSTLGKGRKRKRYDKREIEREMVIVFVHSP